MIRILQKILASLIAIYNLGTLSSCAYFAWGQTDCYGTGEIPPSATYQEVPTTFFLSPTSVKYTAPSRIICTSIAKNLKAFGFDFKGGDCTIYRPGEARTDNTDVYISGAGMPPSDMVEEVATGKPTYASDPYTTSTYKEKAVDGQLDAESYYTSKYLVQNPYLLVDLGEERLIYQVQMVLRQDCCPDRHTDYQVRIGSTLRTDGDFSSYTLMSTYDGPYGVNQGLLVCSRVFGLTGRYVVFWKNFVSTVGLQEVYVYAKPL